MFAGILGVYAMFRPNAPCSTNLLSLLCLQVAESCAFLHRDVKHATTAFFDYGNAESSAFDSVGLCRSTLIKTCCEGRPSSYMEVYKNDGTPKSSILMEFSIIDHLAIGVPPFLETSICHLGAPSRPSMSPSWAGSHHLPNLQPVTWFCPRMSDI